MPRLRLSLALGAITLTTACGEAAVVKPPAAPVAAAPDPASAPGAGLQAQTPMRDPGPDGPISPEERNGAIEHLLTALDTRYVFPDRAKKAVAAVRAKQKHGDYDKITTGRALGEALSTHVNEVLKDRHFRVIYRAERIPEDELKGEPTKVEIARHEAMGLTLNGGFERVERLPGNIGYLEVRSFAFVKRGSAAAAAAMAFLADTDAIIIDVRRNGGGDPETVAALCSYFFDEAVHLNDIYDRTKNETRQYWTSASVSGERYLGKEVYVLVSKWTGSGAEEFAYDLQTQKRATIVGEITWGGANPGERVRLSDHMATFVPTGRAINPITKTNWEGTGVSPDISVPADDALRTAQIKVIEKLIGKASAPDEKERLEQRLKELKDPAAAPPPGGPVLRPRE